MPALRNSALCAALVASSVTSTVALASSHREAPFIAGAPKVDGTDFYMFRSYASGRTAYEVVADRRGFGWGEGDIWRGTKR